MSWLTPNLSMSTTAEPCLVCHKPATDNHHFPRTRRYGTSTVPLCRECHTAAHWARVDVIEALIDLAPSYWMREGTWDEHRDTFDKWLSKREYRTWVH